MTEEDRRSEPDFTNVRFNATSESADILITANSAVNRVIGWHSEQLGYERRAGEPNHERMAELKEGLTQAQADRRSIPLADDEQRQRLIDEYSALYRRLAAE
ncbi:hypothetical protein ACFQ93_35865 [Streptomyces sp. NPDC056601]|uniref:hypothetical protein n=1 Tax=Streptomyces sp. NPDC056601 TaxID=3345875 RepID=UPI0036893F47